MGEGREGWEFWRPGQSRGPPPRGPHPPTLTSAGMWGSQAPAAEREPRAKSPSLSPGNWDKPLPALHLRSLSENFPRASWVLL